MSMAELQVIHITHILGLPIISNNMHSDFLNVVKHNTCMQVIGKILKSKILTTFWFYFKTENIGIPSLNNKT